MTASYLHGPDLTNSLVGVLTRFRENEVAFNADIESMFYQVRVPEQHYSFLRFLWWENGDLEQELQEYHMKVHLFGAVSSPSIANFALRQIVNDHEAELDQEVQHTLLKHFYVDDCLRSVETPEKANHLIKEVTKACSQAGFRLTKFAANDISLVQSIPIDERSKELKLKNLEYDELPHERTLGLQWLIAKDSFGFSIDLTEKPLMRRGILSMISTIFDPLGFIAPFILTAKQLLQELCRETLEWDEEVDDSYKKRFEQWKSEVHHLKTVQVQRCLIPKGFTNIKTSQIHVFADASSTGYGAVAYLRLTDGETIHSSFLMGKARLAPIKQVSIPRLELTAAVVALHVGQMMKKELDMTIQQVTYYTDSTTVIHYIRSTRKRFPVFVANRIQQILEFSSPSQWLYVDTTVNPADIASRGMESFNEQTFERWSRGPDFLRQDETEWPQQPDLSGKREVEPDCSSMATELTEETTGFKVMSQLIEHFSCWLKLKKAVAVYLNLHDMLHMRVQKRREGCSNVQGEQLPITFTPALLKRAEDVILKFVQGETFKPEIEKLNALEHSDEAGNLPSKSPIHALNPYLEHGLLRVGGRISRASIPAEMKHPLILPKKSHVTTLIIREVHEKLAHAGRNHVIAELRKHFWIISINSAVRYCLYQCIQCRRTNRSCNEQVMANLPANRLQPAPPFTYTGVDLFGPFIIKEGRKELKHYGVLYTCLVSRAVHLESVKSLETDSFMNSLQRFIARRGPIAEIRCDNGTNFVGAARDLTVALKEMNHKHIEEKLLRHNITWLFNPPAASHFGGVWERLIRSTRKVLSNLLHDHGTRIDQEGFQTLLCEVEAIINSRPLTAISNDTDDYQPLSPNQILTLKPTPLPPPGRFENEDLYARKRWKRVQYLARLFWSRWKHEYLVGLQRRQKWTKPQRNIKEGDIVLAKDDGAHRYKWPMARVTKVEPDSAGTVRSVKLKTQTSELRRPVQKIVLLLPKEEQA